MFSKFGRRGVAAAGALCLAMVGFSGEASGRTMPMLGPIHAVLGMDKEELKKEAEPAREPTLRELVDQHYGATIRDEQERCLAVAIYHEARGESLDGQLAVAKVVMNRAASPKYPGSWCRVVKQRKQFSFVRNGRFPSVKASSASWAKARAIARIAADNLTANLPEDVLWYHADYVAPKWRHNLKRVNKIGAHIFYRA